MHHGGLCRSIISSGANNTLVDIECRLSNNLPTIVIVGYASKAVHEAKDRLRGAFAATKLPLPRRRITLNLAPADIPKTDSNLDVAMAVAIMAANNQIQPLSTDQLVLGELGLDGSVRPIRGIIGKLLAARAQAIHEFFVPAGNVPQAQLVPGVTIFPVDHLGQLHNHLIGKQLIAPLNTGNGIFTQPLGRRRSYAVELHDIVGQDYAKRAVCIAAAGGHNILLSGSPGSGKSLLAKALPSLLPPLNHEEALEVTHLHSLTSDTYQQLLTERPLRNPHHTLSPGALISGHGLRPGEISLSHRGVLLLDELPEFNRLTLEALRQPLEDRSITVTKTQATTRYPAHFMLAATANPCPCGYYGSEDKPCICSLAQLQRYRSKLSGPLIDRIDLCCSVTNVARPLLAAGQPSDSDDTQLARNRIAAARHVQAARYGSATFLNCDLTTPMIRQHARITLKATQLLDQANGRLALSTRAYVSIIKVARTIADLDGIPDVEPVHISEAVRYRPSTMQP